MTRVAPAVLPALAPLEAALAVVRRRRGPGGTAGLLPGLVAPDHRPDHRLGPASDQDGWISAADLVSGARLDELLDAAARRWRADRHVAAALAWRSYTYWLAMPAVLGWATARRLPLLHPDDVLLRLNDDGPFLTISLRRARLAVLPGDTVGTTRPGAGQPETVLVDSDQHLLRLLRQTLRTDHLDPLLAQVQARVRLGERTLLGSLASAAGYAAVRGLDTPPEQVAAVAVEVLAALGVADLATINPAGGSDPATAGQPSVQRHTCCLAFTLPEPKTCSGCCLRR
jgi:hypothetical protein